MPIDSQHMTRWAFETRLTSILSGTTLSAAPRYDFPAKTIYVPETVRTFSRTGGGRVMLRGSAFNQNTAAITGIRVGIKINAVTADDLDEIRAVTATASAMHVEFERDVTDYFSTNDPGTANFSVQPSVAFACSSGGSNQFINLTMALEVTYAYDSDVAAVLARTAIYPIQSHHMQPVAGSGSTYTEVGTTGGTANAPINQVPQLTGSGGEFDGVTGFTLRQRYLRVVFRSSQTSTGTNIRVWIRVGGSLVTIVPTGVQSTTTDLKFIVLIDITALSTSIAHAFEASCETLLSGWHVGAQDVITYERAESSTLIHNSVIVPLQNSQSSETTLPSRLATTADADRLTATLDIQEPSTITTRRCGVILYEGLFSGGADLVVNASGQTERTYNINTQPSRDSFTEIIHRCDHNGSTWALARGANRLNFDVRLSAVQANVCPISGVAILNYTSGRHPAGSRCHNNTHLLAQVISYAEGSNVIQTPDEPVIVPTDYSLNGVWIDQTAWYASSGQVVGVAAQRLSGEDVGKGWCRSLHMFSTNLGEVGSNQMIHPCSSWFRKRSTMTTKMDIEAERKWNMSASNASVGHQAALYATFHSCTFTVAGTAVINGAAMTNGSVIQIYALESSGVAELVTTATVASGAFTAQVPDNTRTYFASYQSVSFNGRSIDGTPGVSAFNIDINSASSIVPSYSRSRVVNQ